MLKKRIIFTLLYANGSFMLSRNFRLQKVGDVNWLKKNLNFSDVAFYIDELIVLDVSRGVRDLEAFSAVLSNVSAGCFAPIAAGGGVASVEHARRLLRAGADKIVMNTALFHDRALVRAIAAEFGQQCVIGSIDVKCNGENSYDFYTNNGSHKLTTDASRVLDWCAEDIVGEIYLNSIDRDGTGQGYDLNMLELISRSWNIPVIIAGGVGNARHFAEGLAHPDINAVATAHLFNFIGDGLMKARHSLTCAGFELASWQDRGALALASGAPA